MRLVKLLFEMMGLLSTISPSGLVSSISRFVLYTEFHLLFSKALEKHMCDHVSEPLTEKAAARANRIGRRHSLNVQLQKSGLAGKTAKWQPSYVYDTLLTRVRHR
jgi:hypothetical protein